MTSNKRLLYFPFQVKAKALVLAEMNAYLQRQIDKDENLKFEIENTFHDIQR